MTNKPLEARPDKRIPLFRILCPDCKQDLKDRPREGVKFCKTCGQSLDDVKKKGGR